MGVAAKNLKSPPGAKSNWVLCWIIVLALGFNLGIAQAGQKKKDNLSKYYRDWLNRDVAYIITKAERDAFLRLTSDEARDAFIQRFWQIRNPNPNSPTNTYKDDIYSRIAYANAHFSNGSGEGGWRTDRGRTYITLGPPQQKQRYMNAPNLRAIIIWFYSNTNPALPAFFYVMFYDRDNDGDFRYYSPYMDGPDKLISNMEAINDPQAALKMIQDSVGPEVARISQSLLPDEPLDPSGRISLSSDVMLATLKNLANTPENIDALNLRRELIGNVTERLIVNAKNLDIVLLPVRDGRGQTRLDFAVRLRNPADLTLTQGDDGLYSYRVEVRVRVFAPDGKLIFTQQKTISDSLDKERLNEIREEPFGYEGILPLPPGKYHLDFLVTDWAKKVGFHEQRDVTIPDGSSSSFSIPAILPFSTATPVTQAQADSTPFAMAGLKFKPLEISPLVVNSSQDLQVAYQIWAPPKDPHAYAGDNLEVEYALGQPALLGTATVVDDPVKMNLFTASGSLVDGKKFSLADDPDGDYVLTVSVRHPNTPQRTTSSLAFQILNNGSAPSPWDVDEPGIATDQAEGILDERRGLCYLAQGHSTEARLWFREALNRNRGNEISRAHLVQDYYDLKDYAAIVSLFNGAGVTANTDSSTIVLIARSLQQTGNPQSALSLLEDAVHSRPQDASLYVALADCYQLMGDNQKAAEMTHKVKSLLPGSANQ